MKATKATMVINLLQEEWITADDLRRLTGWKPNSLRGFLSTLPKRDDVSGKVERRRLNGVTSYRLANLDNT